MNKIKILFITMLSTFTVNVFCGLAEDLQKKITQIDQNVEKIDATVDGIKAAHNQLKTQLVDAINNQITSEINPALKKVGNSKKDLDDIPGGAAIDVALAVLNIGDLKNTLMSIHTALFTTRVILDAIEKGFKKYVDDLDPDKDPKGIYAKFDESKENLIATKDSLQEMIPLLQLFE